VEVAMSVGTGDLRRFVPSVGSIAGVLFLLIAWQLVSTQFKPYQFPGLRNLADAFWLVITDQTQYSTTENLGISLVRIVLGFLIVMVLGTLTGVFMGISSEIEDYLSTYITVFLTIPSVIWAFMAVLWFGLTELLVPVFVITVIIYPYVTVNMWQGTKAVDKGLIEMADAFKASRSQVWRHIYIPHLTPFTFATARLAFTISWKLSLVAEIFGSNNGVGVVVQNYYQNSQTNMIIAWALPIMLLMLVIERVLQRLEHRAYRWRPEVEGEGAADMEMIE
jgi:NitT/TauT family transport system permease protein